MFTIKALANKSTLILRPATVGLVLAFLVAPAVFGAGTVTGTVFRDYDADGVDDGALEPGVPGVTVTAFDASGAVAGTTTTCSSTGVPVPACTVSNLGFYELAVAGTGPYRIEFSGGPPALQPGAVGAGSDTSVQFIPDPAGGTTANVDYGLANPAQFCLPGARMVSPCYANGDPLATPPGACPGGGPAAGDVDAFVTFLDSADSNDGSGVAHIADADVVGSVWGIAWQRSSSSLFAAAVVKRHVGLGPLPGGSGGSRTGVIYRLTGDLTVDDGATVTPWFNLDDITGVDTGAEPAARGLDACGTEPNYDPNAFDAAGKVGLGDLDIGDDGRTLWVVNLFDRTLYELAIGDPPAPPGDAQVTAHALGGAEPACTSGVFRPWAVKAHDGLVYIGGVCSGESGGSAGDLTAHVLAHDPAGPDGNFTQVFQIDLDYPRGKVSDQGANEPLATWRPWIDDWSDITSPAPGAGPFGQTLHPQPMLTDLEVDVDGSFLLGFLDRAGFQLGNENFQTDGMDTTTYEGVAAGDILRMCFDPDDTNGDGNPFVLELGSDCPGPGGPNLASDQSPPQGPGNREYFWTDYYRWDNNQNDPDGGAHQEITLGGLAHRFGSGELGATAFDPYDDFRAGGIIWMSQADGSRTHSLEIFGQDSGGQPTTFGKAAGLGDLELLCSPAPLELGNRVWCDDGDGAQGAGETPIPGVDVVLQCGADGAVTATTDAAGHYLFTDADYQAVNSTRIPRGASCTISIDTTANAGALTAACGAGTVTPTTPNSGAGANPDLNDSDGVDAGGGSVEISIPDVGGDGDNDHSHDFGFITGPAPIGTIGDTVWCDGLEGTGNGAFDTGEGIAGVRVDLFNDTDCNDTADGPSIANQDTAGDGQYLFSGLAIGTAGNPVCYVVQVDTADPDLGTCNSPITPVEFQPDLDENAPDDLDNDFGFEEPLGTGSIGDTVWCDGLEGTGNGTFDAGEGIPGVLVTLFDDTDCNNTPDGPAIASQNTMGDGQYLFSGLPIGPPGNPVCYVVQVDAADPDLGTCNSPITPVVFQPDLDSNNPDDLDNDFGFEEPLGTGSIGDTVWCDGLEGTGNGTFDAGEGIPGVLVTLFDDTDCNDTPDGPAIATQNTMGDGQYLFSGLPIGPPGNPVCYVVQVDAADPDLGTCNSPITPAVFQPDLDSDGPDDLDNDFGFEELCVDTDGDRICNESCVDDRDGDGDPDCTDVDPQGYLYCEATGEILTGGLIQVTGPGAVTIFEDGTSGRYAFETDGTPGQYDLLVTPPAGFPISTTCGDQGLLDPSGSPNPLALGAGEILATGFLGSAACADNPYYLSFQLEAGDPLVINNNIPLEACGIPTVDIPTADSRGLIALAVLLMLAALAALRLRRRTT